MKVELIRYTPDGEELVAAAAKLCYSKSGITEIEEGLNPTSTAHFLDHLMELGHMSPLEHVTFTFGVEGVSRAMSHQLVRHRIASYSQQSQRYVKLDDFQYIIPPSIDLNPDARKIFIMAMERALEDYMKLVELLQMSHYQAYAATGMGEQEAKRKAGKDSLEDARYVFPNACETKLVLSMNARALLHFFAVRCCNRAQWEIREMARLMLISVKGIYPKLFHTAGPGCVSGPCPEGVMTCGKCQEVREYYRSI